MMNAKKRTLQAVTLIDRDELTCRLLEIGCKMHRIPGLSGAEGMRDIRATVARGDAPADLVADFEAMADAAIMFLVECINEMKAVN